VTADDNAWDLFAEALDGGYHNEGRVVVLVDQDGRKQHVLSPER
jgi:hypothetical protein